jgi:hypothetical protein
MFESRAENPNGSRGISTCKCTPSGSNSVVECDLAKVEVAGSNPVSRSRIQFFHTARPNPEITHCRGCRKMAEAGRTRIFPTLA